MTAGKKIVLERYFQTLGWIMGCVCVLGGRGFLNQGVFLALFVAYLNLIVFVLPLFFALPLH